MTDLKTKDTRVTGSLAARDSYFFVFEYEFVDTHLDFAVDYEIEYGQRNSSVFSDTITSHYEFAIGLIAGGIIGAALATSIMVNRKTKARTTSEQDSKRAEIETHIIYEPPGDVQPVEPRAAPPHITPAANGAHEKATKAPVTIMIKDSVINRSFTDLDELEEGEQ
jgi:hypothetical protein